MRRRALLLASGLLAAVVAVVPAADVAAAAPGCTVDSNGYLTFCDQVGGAPGNRGSIGLVGDSVLIGAATGASTPSLPTILTSQGWGPVRLLAGVGLTPTSAITKITASANWNNGYSPDVVGVNLGANNLGTCTLANITPCTSTINKLLDFLVARYPKAAIWWPKVVQRSYPSGAYTAGMLGWNAALDAAAAARSGRLVIWDWPTALATANPAIKVDLGSIHPISGPEYVKRSVLMAADLGLRMPAHFAGPRVAVPAGLGSGLGYATGTGAAVVRTNTLAAATTTELDFTDRVPAGTSVVNLSLITLGGSTAGFITAYPCGETMPTVSNINWSGRTERVAQAVVRLGAGSKVCVYNSTATSFEVDLNGTFGDAAPLHLTPITPQRTLETNNTGKGVDLVAPVPASAAVAVTVTVNGASSGGAVWLTDCTHTDDITTVIAYEPGETVAGAAYAVTQAGNQVCVHVAANEPAALPRVILDVTGTFQEGSGLAFVPAPATRLLDTRSAVGGWYGRHAARQTVDVVAAPVGAKAVTGTLTLVRPLLNSYVTAFACGLQVPNTSAVNSVADGVMANTTTVGIDPTARSLCLWASQNTNTLFDVVGWWVDPPVPT